MNKLYIYILSLMMLFSSSCAMKKLLWEYLDVERTGSSRVQLPSPKGYEDQISEYTPEGEFCIIESNDRQDEAALIPVSLLKVPSLLLFVLIFLPWALFRIRLQKCPGHSYDSYPSYHPVPIYLKLGRLIYYS